MSRRQLKKEVLASPLISDIQWKEILEYRNEHKVMLSDVETIAGEPMYITLTPAIKERIKRLDEEVRGLFSYLATLDERVRQKGEEALLERSLSGFNDLLDLKASSLSIGALANGTYSLKDQSPKRLMSYKEAVERLNMESRTDFSLNEARLALCYEKALGVEELVSFLREKDEDPAVSRLPYSVNPDYPYCPAGFLEEKVTKLLSAMGEESVSPLIRTLLALVSIAYWRPFDERNEETALLFAKSVYRKEKYSASLFFPLEGFLAALNGKDRTDLNAASSFEEWKKSGDLTYLLEPLARYLDKVVPELKNRIKELRIEPFRAEHSRLSQEEEDIRLAQESEQLSLFDEEGKLPAREEAAPHDEEKAPITEREKEPQEETSPSVSLPAEEIRPPVAPVPRRGPLPYEPEALTERESKEYAKYLLETNPSLTKGQAQFLAFHSTPGRYYTIQQYKKYNRCAYETARTSMDKLAQEGYYRKEAVKNKFVYTPVGKGDK